MSDYDNLLNDIDIEVETMEFEERNYDPIPPGKYMMQVDKAEVMKTKSGDGKYIKASIRIIDGPCENRIIFQNFNYINANSEAQRIGREQLGKLCLVTGIANMNQALNLVGRPFIGKVKIEKSKDPQYSDSNQVADFYHIDSDQAPEPPKQVAPNAASGPASRPASTSGPAKAAAGSRPWEKRRPDNSGGG